MGHEPSVDVGLKALAALIVRRRNAVLTTNAAATTRLPPGKPGSNEVDVAAQEFDPPDLGIHRSGKRNDP